MGRRAGGTAVAAGGGRSCITGLVAGGQRGLFRIRDQPSWVAPTHANRCCDGGDGWCTSLAQPLGLSLCESLPAWLARPGRGNDVDLACVGIRSLGGGGAEGRRFLG